MKIHNIILLSLVVLSLLFGCIEQSNKTSTDQTYRGYASGYPSGYKEFIMSSCNIVCKTKKEIPISFGKKKTFFKISDDIFKKSHNTVDSLIKRKRNDGYPQKPYPINYYFLQYAGYSEGGRKYVYVNLSTFMKQRTISPGLVMGTDFGNYIFLDKEDGYAGYIIIDIKDGRVVKYKFEENETTPIPTEYDD